MQQRPTNPPFWIGLAVAYQLAGKPDKALNVLTSHEESVKVKIYLYLSNIFNTEKENAWVYLVQSREKREERMYVIMKKKKKKKKIYINT